jgi:hypothetical protein
MLLPGYVISYDLIIASPNKDMYKNEDTYASHSALRYARRLFFRTQWQSIPRSENGQPRENSLRKNSFKPRCFPQHFALRYSRFSLNSPLTRTQAVLHYQLAWKADALTSVGHDIRSCFSLKWF